MAKQKVKQEQVLLYAVDDNKQVLVDIKKAADKAENVNLQTADSEDAALDFVSKYEASSENPIFMVDLKIKDQDSGFRILEAIKQSDILKRAPVIILTSSFNQSFADRSYDLGASLYVVKDDDPKTLKETLKSIVNSLPTSLTHVDTKS